ncbi:hypothetical protein PTSG_02377 [Salpingoeca rosetta]|uniref:Uncharacterized protein n=1 Tax=Salpingoeca rosetta (strain ATCC 50818 / BSB-021) TaxID=946362 RepID=F2U211_SALR5|nr:uncharacterized protein PTSG_02377 [Salpingoeca rosetta]EGD81663.1 hypothetical protein PTSG_02377 [Salpingoeca rosetta]|eukprot:XP_004996867.1 hypothetical protein PTSG_02377 [Salpingoeca rosetta]
MATRSVAGHIRGWLSRVGQHWGNISGSNALHQQRSNLKHARRNLEQARENYAKARKNLHKAQVEKQREVDTNTNFKDSPIRGQYEQAKQQHTQASREQEMRLNEYKAALSAVEQAEATFAKLNSMQKSFITVTTFATTLVTPIFVLWRTGSHTEQAVHETLRPFKDKVQTVASTPTSNQQPHAQAQDQPPMRLQQQQQQQQQREHEQTQQEGESSATSSATASPPLEDIRAQLQTVRRRVAQLHDEAAHQRSALDTEHTTAWVAVGGMAAAVVLTIFIRATS